MGLGASCLEIDEWGREASAVEVWAGERDRLSRGLQRGPGISCPPKRALTSRWWQADAWCLCPAKLECMHVLQGLLDVLSMGCFATFGSYLACINAVIAANL